MPSLPGQSAKEREIVRGIRLTMEAILEKGAVREKIRLRIEQAFQKAGLPPAQHRDLVTQMEDFVLFAREDGGVTGASLLLGILRERGGY